MANSSHTRKVARSSALALLLGCAALSAGCGRDPRGDAGGAAANQGATQTGADVAGAGAGDPARLDSDIERLERQVERNPADEETRRALARAYVRRGDAQRSAGQLQESIADYQRALRLDPDNAEAQKNAASATEQVGGGQQGEYGEPAPLPITPNVAGDDARPTPSPTAKRQ